MTPEALAKIRAQFPILRADHQGRPLVYLDNGATVQKPQCVLDALSDYYTQYNANIHRGSYPIADQATQAFEDCRERVRQFLGAKEREEIIFTKGTTEAINLVAATWGEENVRQGDEVLISHLEHHANIVPWQVLCAKKGATLRVIPISEEGDIAHAAYEQLLCQKTKIVAITHASNVLGTINPIERFTRQAHQVGAKVLVDGAQMAGHGGVDVQALGVDFYTCSSHKAYGPMGVGVLYGKRALLEAMPPYQTGGEMVREVRFSKTTYNTLPYKLEAGTPNVGGVVALGRAVEWMQQTGLHRIAQHEHTLYQYARKRLLATKGIRVLGAPKKSVAILSFLPKNAHPYDMGQLLGARGICVRTGNHCADPVVKFFGVDSTVRLSFAAYNTQQEVDQACESIEAIQKKLMTASR